MTRRNAGRGVLAGVVVVATSICSPVTAQAAAGHAPTVSTASPTSGTTAGGTRVTVNGANFSRVSAVRFGSVSVTGKQIKVVSSKRLLVTAPKHAAGTVDVRVVAAAGTSPLRSTDRFQYVAPPTITSVSPTGGLPAGGTRVTIKGANLLGRITVSFGASAGTSVQRVSSSEVRATAPQHAVGTVDIRVGTAYGRSGVVAADRFGYRDAPEPVGALTVQDLTATTVTLRWTPSPSTGLAGVTIRRAVGAVAPAGPSAGTPVATLTPTATAFIDTGLAKKTTYAYALFAYSSAGPLYSTPATIAVTTPADSRPDLPTAFATSPAPVTGTVCSTAPYPWIDSLGGGNLTLGAHISDPDGDAQLIRADFRLWDLGGAGTAAPAYLVAADDPAGQSAPVTGSGGYVTRQLAGNLLANGHLYGVDAVSDDGIARSAASEPCHFWYDDTAPTAASITSPSSTFHVGTPATFDFSASEVVPADGQYSGIDHFGYAFGTAAGLGGHGGTQVPAEVTGVDATASITFTPTSWGESVLYMVAVDKAGNESVTAALSFYVSG